jgi:hypothetical protein
MPGAGPAWLAGVGPGFGTRILLAMTAWIVLSALVVLFALAVRRRHPEDPPLPPGYDGERQLAELRALAIASASARLS